MLLSIQTSKPMRISLTPLIDVVFIMLLFFMLSSSFTRWYAMDLSMPVSSGTNLNEPPRLELVNNKGAILFENRSYAGLNTGVLETLRFRLKASSTQTPLVVDAENAVSTQVLVELIDTLKASGFSRVSMGKTFSDSTLRDQI